MSLVIIALIALSVFLAVKWVCSFVGTAAMVEYMQRKGTRLPTEDEMEDCLRYAWKRFLHIK